jgi:hypothetical protein
MVTYRVSKGDIFKVLQKIKNPSPCDVTFMITGGRGEGFGKETPKDTHPSLCLSAIYVTTRQ